MFSPYRILNRRGRREGKRWCSARRPMRAMIERLLPGANILSRPRLLDLELFRASASSRGCRRRSAIVTFSADEV